MSSRSKGVGLVAAVSIGVGGMIGAGIFSILGVVAQVSGPALPLSFAIGGVVALLAAYSYAKLGVRYPSVGGSVQFLVESLGDGVLTGGLNVFQYLAYVISMALYAAGFAGYAMTFLPRRHPELGPAPARRRHHPRVRLREPARLEGDGPGRVGHRHHQGHDPRRVHRRGVLLDRPRPPLALGVAERRRTSCSVPGSCSSATRASG